MNRTKRNFIVTPRFFSVRGRHAGIRRERALLSAARGGGHARHPAELIQDGGWKFEDGSLRKPVMIAERRGKG
ncbi:hypothetical protein MHYP_G00028620 [Metynnis hypsauchen]